MNAWLKVVDDEGEMKESDCYAAEKARWKLLTSCDHWPPPAVTKNHAFAHPNSHHHRALFTKSLAGIFGEQELVSIETNNF